MYDDKLYVLTGYSAQGGFGLTTVWKCKMCGALIQVLGVHYPRNGSCPICGSVNWQNPPMRKKTDWSEFVD